MSDIPYRDPLDIRAVIAKIDRDRAETQKLFEESIKFSAEARKISRDYFLAPVLAVAAVIGGLLGAISFALRMGGH
jgi:hypothetical protein